METIERSFVIEKGQVKIPSYTVRFRRNFAPSGTSDAQMKFVVSHNSINAKLVNKDPIAALRFEIEFKDKFVYRPITFSHRIQSLNSYINFQDTFLTIVILDIDGKGIPTGDDTIANIPIDDRQDFQVTGAYASTRTTGIKEIEYTVVNETDENFITLEQNDPNPFNTSTNIEFWIAEDAEVKVVMYDVGGALVRTLLDSQLRSGTHEVEWDGKDDSGNPAESGIYLCKLYAGVYSVTKKMLCLK
ncbi:MAG TPA: FlgD immunoglobulin-like domain containing protein [Candidatus Acidoferrales bacterium]|nr:FlgD immunoglobulin-like domain containing protein [Candidatus Acidoferrales bacterium]